jgi:phosphoribosylformimino-5-aminoimidazole carboxamide ribonucleotide (ProFAR) isomerase
MNLYGAIIGKALYEETIDLEKLIKEDLKNAN